MTGTICILSYPVLWYWNYLDWRESFNITFIPFLILSRFELWYRINLLYVDIYKVYGYKSSMWPFSFLFFSVLFELNTFNPSLILLSSYSVPFTLCQELLFASSPRNRKKPPKNVATAYFSLKYFISNTVQGFLYLFLSLFQ